MAGVKKKPGARSGEQGAKPQRLKVHIRWMIRRDMPEVLAIERACFEFPWFEEEFIRCLRQRNCLGMVAEHDERVVAFVIFELHKTRLQLLNLAVAADVQRRRVGEQMVDKLTAGRRVCRRSRTVTEVRETNLAAQVFFRACGFRCVDMLQGFYDDSDEEAYVFEWRLPGPAEAATAHRANRFNL